MLFRNLSLFTLPPTYQLPIDLELVVAFSSCRLRPVGKTELQSRGFVAPFQLNNQSDADLLEEQSGCMLFAVGTETRVMPAAAVHKAIRDRMAEAEERMGGLKISGRQRKAFKEDVIAEMLPRAFVTPAMTLAYIDPQLRLLVIDTASRKEAEAVASEVRHALGSFPVLPLAPQVRPEGRLTLLLLAIAGTEDLNDRGRFTLGDSITLADPADKGAVVTMRRADLTSDETAQHLDAGKQVTRLEVTFDDHLEMKLDADLIVRGVKFLEGAMAPLDDQQLDSTRQEYNARFALQVGELRRLYPVLKSLFQLEAAP